MLTLCRDLFVCLFVCFFQIFKLLLYDRDRNVKRTVKSQMQKYMNSATKMHFIFRLNDAVLFACFGPKKKSKKLVN